MSISCIEAGHEQCGYLRSSENEILFGLIIVGCLLPSAMSHHVVTANLTRTTMTETILEEIVPLEELRIDINSKVYLYSPVNEIVSAQLVSRNHVV